MVSLELCLGGQGELIEQLDERTLLIALTDSRRRRNSRSTGQLLSIEGVRRGNGVEKTPKLLLLNLLYVPTFHVRTRSQERRWRLLLVESQYFTPGREELHALLGPPHNEHRRPTRNALVEKGNAREETKGPSGVGSGMSRSSCWVWVSYYDEEFRSKRGAGGLTGLLNSFLFGTTRGSEEL